ncbi:MAG: hypothetical protein HC939_23125 [Pleurocapsa sp. SU_5_0]|nr:hypothetical protein [Pleurocapsa sp. SU_5_0]NJR45786.1 hypothetical protein [Hyellaceae cyanobacterium CSU_1_1]
MKQAFFWLATVDSVKDSGKLWRDRNNLNSQQSVTVLITRRPRKSNQKEFERALSDTIDAAGDRYKVFLSSSSRRPSRPGTG